MTCDTKNLLCSSLFNNCYDEINENIWKKETNVYHELKIPVSLMKRLLSRNHLILFETFLSVWITSNERLYFAVIEEECTDNCYDIVKGTVL